MIFAQWPYKITTLLLFALLILLLNLLMINLFKKAGPLMP